MDDSADNAGLGPSQQTNNDDAEPIEPPMSNIELNNRTIGGQEEENLRSALENHDLSRIDNIFETNPSLVCRPLTRFGETPLHFALRRGLSTAVVEHLLDRRDIQESLETPDYEGFLPFQLAIYKGRDDGDIIKSLIDRTSPGGLVSKTEDGDTAIHLASRSGWISILDILCPLLPEGVIDSTNKAGLTAIHEGVGEWEVVSCLLSHNASRFIDNHGNTLLHAAVSPKTAMAHIGIKTRRQLLAAGAELGTQNNEGNTPLHLTAGNLNSYYDGSGMALTVLQELLGLSPEAPHHEQTQSSLAYAVAEHNKTGDTILHLIASSGTESQLECRRAKQAAEDILSVCRNVLVSRDGEGNTPLHRACFVGNWAVVEALLQAGERIGAEALDITNLANEAGNRPLHLAAHKGHLEAVKRLLAADHWQSVGTILIRNNRKETPIHLAAGHGHPEILEELLKGWTYEEIVFFDNECELRDEAGMTPLHLAAQMGPDSNAIRVFDQILNGCTGPTLLNDVEPRNKWPALHFAARSGHERIVELLLLNGADNKKTDRHNLGAADVARRANRIEIADFIRKYRSRSFRSRLEANEENEKVDHHFLALSWPKWDKSVRQQRGESPRMWPQVISVHQMIFNVNDTHHEARLNDRKIEEYRRMEDSPRHYREVWDESRKTLRISNLVVAIGLAPIHQAQIRLSSCDSKGWSMEEGREFREAHNLEEIEHRDRQDEEPYGQVYVYDSIMFQGKERSTWWIHFPANKVGTKIMANSQTETSLY